MKLCNKALSTFLAAATMLTAISGAIPAIRAEGTETQLTLETEDNLETGMDALPGADWIQDNLLRDAIVTVSGNPKSGADQNKNYKGNMYDGEASNEWSVGESGNDKSPSIPKVTVDFETPQTVKELVLANCNNPTRFVSEAKITLTDKDGNTYVYTAGNIDKGGMPGSYVFSRAIENVVKAEVIVTKQGQQNNGALSNGYSYLALLDKRYKFTGNKTYYAKNHIGSVGIYDEADGLEGVYIPENASTGNAYLLNGTGGFAGRRPRLVKGTYKVTLYAKLYEPAIETQETTVFKLKYDNNTLNFDRSDFSAVDEYVKIEKNMTLNGDKNSDLKLEYQAGSGAVKIDRILIGKENEETPDPVQPTPPVVDPNELETELPGVTGDEYDPDGKTWIEANLLNKADKSVLVNSATEKAGALSDGNEAVTWNSDTDKAVVTADFSGLEEKPTLKKVILVSLYSKTSNITKAKITIKTSDGTEKYYTANGLRTEGAANEITFKDAIKDVSEVKVEALSATSNAGWAELALLDKRYEYERSYYTEYSAVPSVKEQGIVDPPSGATEESFPVGDWPRGVLNNSGNSGYMIWSPQLNLPAGSYKVAIYAKVYSEETLTSEKQLFNIESFANPKKMQIFTGKDFSKADEYEILKTDITFSGFYSDRLSFWNYNNGRFKIHKIVVYTENTAENLPEPPKYVPQTPENPDIPSGLTARYYRDPNNLVTLPYRIYIPQNYSADKKYSFLLFLHGAGSRGYGNDHVKNVGIINTIMNDPVASEKFIIVAPQCAPNNQWVNTPWGNGSYSQDTVGMSSYLAATYDLICNLKNEYSVDENRMYITGLSMGGYGTWDMITRYPDMFAAAIPICGAADLSRASLIKDIPIWAFHSKGDATVPSSGSRDMVEALKEVGGSVKYTEYSDDAHDAWTRAYSTEELYTWLYSQHKTIYGDANGDEAIDIRDLIKIKKMISTEEYSKEADCNKDSYLNADDIVLMKKHLLGILKIS